MFLVTERLATFATASSSASTSTAKKRQSAKAAAAASSSSPWPHPVTGRSAKASSIPSPKILAEQGFYHSPTPDAPDAVTHFLYPDVHIANWQPNDDPFARLEEALPGNGWCRRFRSLEERTFDEAAGKWIWQQADLLPTSKEIVQARKESFGSQWPYDGKKGWKPTSKKLAEAGFFFTPTEEEPDNAKCIYCDKSLGGWEKSDDPVHEHQRRNPDCAFFNCELREATSSTQGEETVAEETAATVEPDEEPEPIVNPKNGGKRAVSATTRKASAKVSKAKKSMAATAPQDEEETADVAAEEEVSPEEPIEPVEATTKKGGRKTRNVSTRKAAPKQDIVEETAEESEPVEEAAPVEAKITRSASSKKGATGLGNGNEATASRPTRAASRRATKAIGLITADDDVNRIPRRPDKEDLEQRELALSDPIPFPTPASEDQPVPATDPVQPVKPKRSRSKSKKLDKEPAPEPEPEPEPEVEAEVEEEEEVVPMPEDNTIIEHDVSEAEAEVEEEPVEEPKRRGRGTKSSSASSAAKSSSAGTTTSKSRKTSSKIAASSTPAEPEDEQVIPEAQLSASADSVAFPSMSSEANDEPSQQQRSSRSVSNSLAVVSSAKGSRKATPSSTSSTSSKRASAKPVPEAAKVESDIAVSSSAASLPNTGSQATIRGAPRTSSPPAPTAAAAGRARTPLAQLPQLTTLDLDESQRSMTLGEWLQMKADAAAQEMREQGEAQLRDTENKFREARRELERRVRSGPA